MNKQLTKDILLTESVKKNTDLVSKFLDTMKIKHTVQSVQFQSVINVLDKKGKTFLKVYVFGNGYGVGKEEYSLGQLIDLIKKKYK